VVARGEAIETEKSYEELSPDRTLACRATSHEKPPGRACSCRTAPGLRTRCDEPSTGVSGSSIHHDLASVSMLWRMERAFESNSIND
jgi:hypothetical protein